METLYLILQSSHSGLRWLTLVTLILTIGIFFLKWQKKSGYKKSDKTVFTITLSLLHIQVLIGIFLYFISPKVLFVSDTMSIRLLRFFTVEHALMMIVAAVLLTIGSVKVKKKETDVTKFKTGFWFAFITLVIILLGIPWPLQALGAGWF